MIEIVGILTIILFLIFLALIIAFKDWILEKIKEFYDYKFRKFLVKLGLLPPLQEKEKITQEVKILIINTEKFVQNEYNITVKPNLDQEIIEQKNNELTTSNQEVKLNMLSNEFNKTYPIVATKKVHNSVYSLLENDNAKAGFQLYFAYRSSILEKNEYNVKFIEEGLKKLPESYTEIKRWFDIIQKLDIEGDFTTIALPLSEKIKDIDEKTKKEFSRLLLEILKEEHPKPLNVGKLKIAILRIGKPTIPRVVYYNYIAKFKKQNSDVIILCARGDWAEYCRKVAEWAKILYKFNAHYFEAVCHNNIQEFNEKKGKKTLRIFLTAK